MRWSNLFIASGLALLLACGQVPVAQDATPPPLPGPFRAGMTFAHEGYQGYNGYGGRTVGPSLDSLTELNVNAVAIVPYTYMRRTDEVDHLPVPDHRGAENDSAVVASIRAAHERGLYVMLKPQIWVHGAWPGDVDMATEAEWDDFFAAYEAWMAHYARMAEAEGVGALCAGTELVRATLDHPDRWRGMAARWRGLYGGTLTYAANWGEEFENFTLWDCFDVIGLNAYYPLSAREDPTDAQLLAGARRWVALADSSSVAYDKPVWLTEVGYRSVDRAWQNPHAAADGREVSYAAQSRCYAAMLEAATDSGRIRGVYVWKWPSYLGHDEGRDGRDNGFTPGGKSAGKVLARYYGGQLADGGDD